MQKDLKILKNLKAFLDLESLRDTEVFHSAMNLIAGLINVFLVLSYCFISTEVSLAKWIINSFCGLFSLFIFFFFSTDSRNKIALIILNNLKLLVGKKFTYSYAMKHKNVIFSLFKNEDNREDVLFKFLENLRNKQPIDAKTISLLYKEIANFDSTFQNKSEKTLNEINEFFQKEQDLTFFQEKSVDNEQVKATKITNPFHF